MADQYFGRFFSGWLFVLQVKTAAGVRSLWHHRLASNARFGWFNFGQFFDFVLCDWSVIDRLILSEVNARRGRGSILWQTSSAPAWRYSSRFTARAGWHLRKVARQRVSSGIDRATIVFRSDLIAQAVVWNQELTCPCAAVRRGSARQCRARAFIARLEIIWTVSPSARFRGRASTSQWRRRGNTAAIRSCGRFVFGGWFIVVVRTHDAFRHGSQLLHDPAAHQPRRLGLTPRVTRLGVTIRIVAFGSLSPSGSWCSQHC